ncbi:ankyrin repeat-containing domain protein, partial [Diplogelasinospora grovesii]
NLDEFQVAIFCALRLEATAVCALFDKQWDHQRYDEKHGSLNGYSFGTIACHNVVLVHLPTIGKVAAAAAAARLDERFRNIELALVVGVCGGVPGKHSQEPIFLGDVVISNGLIQHDLGRRLPGNKFARKDTPEDNLSRPNWELRAVLAKLQTDQGRSSLQNRASKFLGDLRQKLGNAPMFPGVTDDCLFKSTYQHKHREPSGCEECCNDSGGGNPSDAIAEWKPAVHFGCVASGDTVMKSGEDRDAIAAQDRIIAFEMEGAGVWDNFPNVLVIKGVCDYADSHKNKRWQRYAAATAAAVANAFLESWDTEPPKRLTVSMQRDRDPGRDRDRTARVLQKLYTIPYGDRKDRNPDRIPGTCVWFEDHRLFREWQESKASTMLWVSADPGCGKSVLVKHLVDSGLLREKARTICYFFFKDDFEDQRSVVGALRSILHQLFKEKPTILSECILKQFEDGGETFNNSFGDLWHTLLSAAEEKDAGQIVCLLDAVDECEEDGRSQLLQALGKLFKNRRTSNLKFLLTSRPYEKIRQGFHGLSVIHLSGESDAEMGKISGEIDAFIEARVQDIAERQSLSGNERRTLWQEMKRTNHRTYLWAHLTLDLIERDLLINKTGIIKATSHLPQTVEEAYERILSKSYGPQEAKRLLHIVVAAAQPLTLKEMSLALALKEGHQSYSDLDLTFDAISEQRFRNRVRNLCGLFVTIIDSRIYLLHQTAREFLIRHVAEDPDPPVNTHLGWKHSLRLQESHYILAEICIQHLLFADFETAAFQGGGDEQLSQYAENHVLLDYSARNWVKHLHESHRAGDFSQKVLQLFDERSQWWLTWFRIFWTSTGSEFPRGFTPLMAVSYLGLTTAAARLLETGDIDPDAEDDTYKRSALSWAAGNGFDSIVTLLLQGPDRGWRGTMHRSRKKTAVNTKDRDRRTPLTYAALNGHTEIVKLLLEARAKVNVKDVIEGTPLSYAVCAGHQEILQLMLKGGSVSGSQAANARKLIVSAVRNKHEAIIKALFDTRNVNLANLADPVLLFQATMDGSVEIVKTLLATKFFDVNSKDTQLRTPLFRAAAMGHDAVVGLLLSQGAEVNTTDTEGWTPLLAAARYGQEAVVDLLLSQGAAFKPARGGSTALSLAAGCGHEAVVKLLLAAGAEVNERSWFRWTPLLLAAENGYEAVVELLLSNGAWLDVKNAEGDTPLSKAAANGHEDVVRLLLAKGAKKNKISKEGATALYKASAHGRETVVRLLLAAGAEVDSKDEDGKTALFQAAILGHVAIGELLIGAGADVDSRDWNGKTPLFWAAENGQEVFVRLLLAMGASVNILDKDDLTPLSWAKNERKWTVVDLLKNAGADINLGDTTDRISLTQLALNVPVDAIEALLGTSVSALTQRTREVAHRYSKPLLTTMGSS